jgi:hypothetical protein
MPKKIVMDKAVDEILGDLEHFLMIRDIQMRIAYEFNQ